MPEEFEYYLKYLKTQNNYFSFFNYKGQDFFVNNIFLHQKFKDYFLDVKNISWINPIIKNNIINWEISMKEIYYNNIHFKNKIIFELNPLFELIIGNHEYKDNIKKDFFNYYIDKKICTINEIKDYIIFECNSNIFSNADINKFPDLYIYNNDINHVFEMNAEELFTKINNKYFFNIVFPSKISKTNNNKWTIGKIFFRKYPVIFSPTNRIIGFYINQNEGKAKKKEKIVEIEIKNNFFSKKIYLYATILLICIVFTWFGLRIGKKLFFPKFKAAKELTDNEYYEYDYKDINKKENKNSYSKYKSIEMNSKIAN
jgi:hypothetical protein